MTANCTCEGLPNPFTPLAYVPPDLAQEIEIARYILAGATGAFVWDILSNVKDEYKVIFKTQFSLPTGVYILSRVASFVFVFVSTLWKTSPVDHCNAFEKFVTSCLLVSTSTTSLLFFLRIRAIFRNNKPVVIAFFILWLGVLGGSMTVPFALVGENLGPTKYCADAVAKPFAGSIIIVPMIHDTIVFLAISTRLIMNSRRETTLQGQLRMFFSGRYLPTISAVLLKDGQLYYVITVLSNTIVVIFFFLQYLPVGYRTMLVMPNTFLTNTMACRIFRNARLKLGKKSGVVILGTIQDDPEQPSSNPFSLANHRHYSRSGDCLELDEAGKAVVTDLSTAKPANIEQAHEQKA